MTRQGFGLVVGSIVVVCAHAIMAQCNTIDAVTTASFKITGGQACTTYAKLNWSFNESNGTMTIRWGTSTSYGSQKSVYASNPMNITGLAPKTRYYYAVDGFFENITHTYTRSSFTTSGGGTAARPDLLTRAKGGFRVTIGNTGFSVPAQSGEPVAVDLFALSGSAVAHRALVSAGGTTGLFRNVGPGIYLALASWRGGSTQQKVFIEK